MYHRYVIFKRADNAGQGICGIGHMQVDSWLIFGAWNEPTLDV